MSQFLGQLTTRVAATAIVGTRTSTEREEFGEVYIAHCYAACAELCCVVVGGTRHSLHPIAGGSRQTDEDPHCRSELPLQGRV